MRPEAIRKALLEAEERPTWVHRNDGTKLRILSREHWMVGPEPFRNVASIATVHPE